MSPLPTGFVTFLFTDIEGSTRLHRHLGERFAELIADHDRLLTDVITVHGGSVIKSLGDGLFAAMTDARAGLEAAVEIQRRVAQHEWPAGTTLRVRIGLHAGIAAPMRGDYVALAVHQAARVCAAAHGGQVVLTEAVASPGGLPGVPVMPLGEHRLKDFDEPIALWQVGTDQFPPLRSQAVSNLPRPASTFVGRAQDLEWLVSTLSHEAARFTTLTGAGGVGKTRLAIEGAWKSVDAFPAGVFWVELTALRDEGRVLAAVASTVGAGEQPLADHVGARRMLIVLDNVEQVIDVAPRLASLLEACPNLHLLVTSRERLRVRGEVVRAVEPMTENDAVALFSARAALPPSPDVKQLANAVDRLPLGLELAAARTRVLPVGQILSRLGSRLDSLKGGRDADPRQRTLRGTIAWSYELLDGSERRLFARLAIFEGGCTLDAAEAVADADIDVLASLVDKSLLVNRSGRFSYLDTIQEFAAERLSADGEHAEMRRRHSAWYVELAHNAHVGPRGGEQQQWIDIAGVERANFRALLDRAIVEEVPGIFDLATALIRPWRAHGMLPEIVAWYRLMLPRTGALDLATRATAMEHFGSALFFCDEHDEAEDRLRDARNLYRATGDERGEASTLNQLGSIAWIRGDSETAIALRQAALEIFRRHGDEQGVSRCLHFLGEQLRDIGDFVPAVDMLNEAISISQTLGESHALMTSMHSLGDLWLDAGHLDDAQDAYGRALAAAAALGDELSVSYCLAGLACVQAGRDDATTAGQLWGAAGAIEHRLGQTMLAKERQRYTTALQSFTADKSFRAGMLEGAATSMPVMVNRWTPPSVS